MLSKEELYLFCFVFKDFTPPKIKYSIETIVRLTEAWKPLVLPMNDQLEYQRKSKEEKERNFLFRWLMFCYSKKWKSAQPFKCEPHSRHSDHYNSIQSWNHSHFKLIEWVLTLNIVQVCHQFLSPGIPNPLRIQSLMNFDQ